MNRLIILLLLTVVLMTSCSLDNQDITDREWKYGDGFWIGDFPTFGSDGYRLSNDTIYLTDTSKALIIKTSKKYIIFTSQIEIKSLSTGKLGTYHDLGLKTK